jgi:superfamily I DNA and/or RNA helicase
LFPSQHFYQNLLTDAPQALALRTQLIRAAPTATATLAPLRFLDTRSSADTQTNTSFRNEGEVRLVMQLLDAILRLPDASASSIALITPYKAQVNRLRAAMQDHSRIAPAQSARRLLHNEIEVNSIDGFQGREKDIVIFSTVRSSFGEGSQYNGRKIGFVADARRLNVAITRSKRVLIIVGNARTLQCDATWQAMIQNLHGRNCVRSVQDGAVSSDLLRYLTT